MQILRFLLNTTALITLCFCAQGQNMPEKSKEQEEKRKAWIDANLYRKQDAVEFIKLTNQNFTYTISKHETESGVYKRDVKYMDCQLIIETEMRDQASSWKSDHSFEKNVIVIDLDKVVLEGNLIKPASDTKPTGLYGGRSFTQARKIPSWSILTGLLTDNDKWELAHYEEHLQWAFQYLIEQCKAKPTVTGQ